MIETVIIVGNGKLSSSIISGLPDHLRCSVNRWENNDQYPAKGKAVVHVGSGRQFNEVLDYCRATKTPLIQGATDITGDFTAENFTFINAPNFNLLMLKFMQMIKQYGSHFKDNRISITESHQKEKKSLPGTAADLARSLGVDAEKIRSIRNPDMQKELYGIPEEHLKLHAFHEIRIEDDSTSINIRTLVKGHDSYIPGIAAVIKALDHLDGRYYHITELIEMKLI